MFNNLTFPINVIPGGLSYGPYDVDLQAAPGKTAIYTWTVPAQVCAAACCRPSNLRGVGATQDVLMLVFCAQRDLFTLEKGVCVPRHSGRSACGL